MSAPRFHTSAATRQERQASPWWSVHVARYLFALPYVKGCRVLDIACGTGYGLAILEKHARCVVGADIDSQAARVAQAELGTTSGQVIVADGRQLPFADEGFEVITSFETLEHLEHRERFAAELCRVLAPEGVCIISTPNANHTLPVNGKPKNPYHFHEYTPQELQSELGAQFMSVTILGQDLDPRFVVPPFWDDQEQLSKRAGMRKHVLLWRVLNKLPLASLRNLMSNTLLGHPFLPSEADYQFSEDTVNTAGVLVAICRKAA